MCGRACASSAGRCVSWLRTPGAGLRASIRSGDCGRFASSAARRNPAREAAWRFFSRFASRPPEAAHLAHSPLVYSPPRASFGRLPRNQIHLRPARGCLSLSAHLEPTVAWRELRAELRRAVGESTYEIWLASLELRSVRSRHAARRRHRRPRTTGSPSASGGSSRAAPESHSGRTSGSSSPVMVPIARTDRAPRPRASTSPPARSTPATASTSSSSATATASPTPRRWRSPSFPARPTTRCSSTPRRASARRTSSTRSATTCSRSAAARSSDTRPSRRSPTTSSERSGLDRSIASSRPTATPTCC